MAVHSRFPAPGIVVVLALASAPSLCESAELPAPQQATVEFATGHDTAVDSVFGRPLPWIELTAHQAAGSDSCSPAASAGGGCCSGLCTRPTLTGGLFGLQPCLAEKGIMYDAQLTQFGQRVTSGGTNQDSAWGGKLDQFLILDSGKMGLWQGGQMILHAETRMGDDVILDAAGLAPVNGNLLYPSLNNETAITGLIFQQALSEEWAVSVGKFNAFDLLNMLYPQTGRGIDGFMNTSLFLPMTLARTQPLSFVGASLIKLHEGQIQGSLSVYDSQNVTTTTGLEDLFENGANIMGLWRFFTDFGGLPGSHGVMGSWAAGDYTSLDRTGWSFNPITGLVVPQQSTSWSIDYIAEQKVWVDARNPQRNIGVMSQWGYADPETSPYEWIANISLQAQGVVPGRELDSFGVGYFYSGLSEDFKNLVGPLVPINDLQGCELYYNAALTPWFRVTGDLQVVEPAIEANDPAVVLGLRAWLHL